MNLSRMNFCRHILVAFLLAGFVSGVDAQQAADTPAAQSSATAADTQLDELLQSDVSQSAAQQADVAPTDAPAADALNADAPPATETVDTIPVPQRAESATPANSEPRRSSPHLEEIVVTATKREESLRDIPATVNVLKGDDLERQGVQSIEQIVSQVPGVNLTDEGTGGTAKRITIRGISTGMGVNPTAGMLLGDIPFSDPFIPKVSLDTNPFDIATVEVLKGPQGTLFGGTGLNGMIRYVPQAPQLDEFRVKYYGQRQSYPGNGGSAWNYGGMVNVPFADHTAGVRLVAFHRESPGYVDDTRDGGKPDVNTLGQYGFRGELTWLPAEYWKIALMATTQHTNDDDLSYTSNYNGQLQHSDSPRPSPAKSSYTLGSLNIEREFDWGTVISQSSYFQKKFNIFLEASRAATGVLPILAGADANHSKGMTQEFRLVSTPGDSPWKWLAGAFYYKLHLYDCASVGALEGLPSLPIPGGLEGLVANPCPGNQSRIGDELIIGQLIGDVDIKEKALFGELTRKFGDYWDLTLGGRGYHIESGGTVSTSGALYASSNNFMPVSRDAGVAQRGFSPKASITFHPTDELRAYFTVSRGFRFGGPQIAASTPTTTVPPFYKSDSLMNYELGLRTDWLDQTLTVDASAYHIDWKNPQVFQITADRQTNFIDNVGGAKGNGLEMSLRYLVPFLTGLSFDSSASWNRTATTQPFHSATGVVLPTNSPWPLSPRWQTSTTLAYTLPIEDWQAGASVRHAYMSHACNSIECTAHVFGYSTLDVNVFASGPEGSYWPQLSLSMNNLTDKRGISNVTTNPVPATDTVNYIAPRALVLRLSGSF